MFPVDLHSIFQRRLVVKHSIASSSSQLALAHVLSDSQRARAGLQDALKGTAALQQAWQRNFASASSVQANASRSSNTAVEVAEQSPVAQVIDTNLVTEAQQSYLSVCKFLLHLVSSPASHVMPHASCWV